MPDRTPAIRQATAADAERIAPLLAELGYPATVSLVQQKLRMLEGSPDDRVFVSELERDMVGVASLHRLPLFHAEGFLLRITALVVAERVRGTGVGRALVAAAEDFAWSHECVRIEVTSGDHRPGAHAFYQRMGYEADERRFIKRRAGTAPPRPSI